MIPGRQYIVNHRSRADVFTLWALGDLHLGNKACAIERLKRDITQIAADPQALWLGMGDYAEFIGYQDRRFDPEAISDDIKVKDLGQLGRALMKQVRDLLVPIKEKCVGILQGNHERKYEVAKEQEGLTAWLATELEARSFDYSTVLDLIFRRKAGACKESHAFRIFAHHGAGFSQTSGGKTVRLERFMDDWPYCDLVMIAHVHEGRNETRVRLDGDRTCDHIVQRIQRGVITGSYLRTYAEGVTTYAEQRGYRPVPLGAVAINIKPVTREISVTT